MTSALAEFIRELIWPYFDTTKACYPPYICCFCKTNLYVLGRGDTAKLSAWINSLTQVIMFSIFCQYIIKVYGRRTWREREGHILMYKYFTLQMKLPFSIYLLYYMPNYIKMNCMYNRLNGKEIHDSQQVL